MSTHIKIGDIAPRIRYAADGATAVFTYPFPIFQVTDLEVYVDETLQTLTTHYVVDGAGQSAGGSVTFTAAPANGTTVTLVRRLAIRRTSDFQASGEFRAKVINDELDFQIAALQQVGDDQARSLRLSRFDDTASLELPDEASRASKVLAFDGNGDVALSNLTLAEIETGASGPQGPTGPIGPAGADGADGVFTQVASQAEAEAGADNAKGMTPLRTAQAIAALSGVGKVVQMQVGTSATQTSTTSISGFVSGGLSVSITPTNAANAILIVASTNAQTLQFTGTNDTRHGLIALYDGDPSTGTKLVESEVGRRLVGNSTANAETHDHVTLVHSHAPGDTSAHAYYIGINCTSSTCRVAVQIANRLGTIIALEIAA